MGNSDLNGSAADDNVRYLSLTGILTTVDFHQKRIEPGLNRLKTAVFGHTGVILHRREAVRREGQFAILREADPARIFDEGLKALVRAAPYLVLTVSIDKRAHLERYTVWRYDPYHYCLSCLIERYVSYLQRHDAYGDVVIEPRFKKADKRLKESFQRLYNEGTMVVPASLMQKRLLSSEMKFAPKAANVAGMQLCDMIAHPSHRSMKFEREGLPQPDDFGTALVDILNGFRYARDPKTQRIDGWGRKWLP